METINSTHLTQSRTHTAEHGQSRTHTAEHGRPEGLDKERTFQVSRLSSRGRFSDVSNSRHDNDG